MRRKFLHLLQVCVVASLPPLACSVDLTCEALLMLSGNISLQSLAASWNQTLSNTTSQWSGSGIYCDTSIDGIGTCWPRSSAGQIVSRPCPEMFYGVRYNTTNNVYRKCLANGTWALKGNYSMCKAILHEEKKSKMHYHIAVIINFLGHCISMVALLIAFFLFLCLRSIRCLRNIIHWNLITAFILRNATWFIVQLTMSPEIWCRLVTASFNYFHSTNFFWMFGEGCYLHTAIVLTYSTDKLRKWMFICIGWCIPFPIIVAWAIGKLYYDNEKCWFGKRAGVYTDYIYQGPMILVLVINFIFLFNIVRILMTKLRASTTSETIQYRKAVKATLVLLPLLGITYMLFFVNPGEDEISQIVFIYFNSFLESFQGFFVSVFYCFLNSEVRSAVRKRFHRWQEQHSIRARMTQAMSIPTSPSRVSFHSIKQSTSL
ncbi:corticotropin-releasing factor receptor 1 isoform 2-T2 [Xenentodon cancila]